MQEVMIHCLHDVWQGETGWKCLETPLLTSYPMLYNDSSVLAHDLVEHVNGPGAIGSIDDELEALGGVHLTRGQWNDFQTQRHVPIEKIFANDISNLCKLYAYDLIDFRTPVPEVLEGDYDEEFLEYLACGRIQWEEELEWLSDPEDDEAVILQRTDNFFTAALYYMRAGVEKHQRIYPDTFDGNNAYNNIKDTMESVLKEYKEFEYMEILVKFSPEECTYELPEDWDDE